MAWPLSLFNNKLFKYGVPFFAIVIGGSFGLKEFSQLKYQYAKCNDLDPAALRQYGIEMKKKGEVTLETEYEKIKGLALQEWENVRAPRPWEPDTIQKPDAKKSLQPSN